MHSYHRLWLSVLVVSILISESCGFTDEVQILENGHLNYDDAPHHVEAHAAAATQSTFSEVTDTGDTDVNAQAKVELFRSLRLEPSEVDFGVWTVGMVRSRVVTLINKNRYHSVQLRSLTGWTPIFYSSPFEARTIPPNGNTTVTILFLPRDQGLVNTSLHMHTSFGDMQLMVSGEGRESPYRIRPLVGIKAPLNCTLMPEIHVYNPHDRPIEILQVFISDMFKLEMPTGGPTGEADFWVVPPYEKKPIIRILFHGASPGNYSAFLRISIAQFCSDPLDAECASEQILIIPVEFEILPHYGFYAVNPLVELGHLTVGNDTRGIGHKLLLRHSKSQQNKFNNLKLHSVSNTKVVRVPDIEDYSAPIILIYPQDIPQLPAIKLDERVLLTFKDTTSSNTYHKVELIVRAHIFRGCVHYDEKATFFSAAGNQSENIVRSIALRNDFFVPITIYKVTVDSQVEESAKSILQANPFETARILQPGASAELLVTFRVDKHQPDLKDLRRNYKTAVRVYTNITNFDIPLVMSSNRLFVSTQTWSTWRPKYSVYTKELHLSSFALKDAASFGYVILHNRNMMPIKVTDWTFEKADGISYSVSMLGCANGVALVDLHNSDYRLCDILETGDISVFQVRAQADGTNHKTSNLTIRTPHENITIAVKLHFALGPLEVDQEKLQFQNCFPGKICSSPLSIRSSLKEPIHLKSIQFLDDSFRFKDRNPNGSKILPHTVTSVGRIFFDPSAWCGQYGYIEQLSRTDTILAMDVSNDLSLISIIDVMLRKRIELFRDFKYTLRNLSFIATTKEKQDFSLNFMVDITWPRLVTGPLKLPPVELNKSQIFEVEISNPHDQPLLINYALSNPALAKQTKLTLPPEVIASSPGCYLTDKPFFSLHRMQNAMSGFVLPPSSRIKVPISFRANSLGSFCTLLQIRNNLTLFEGVWISAKAIQTQFRFGNRKPGSPTPLLFEVTEQQLSLACSNKQEGEEGRLPQPQIVSRRVFTARNSGESSIFIKSFWIDDMNCKGYGFEVMDCSSFELKANSSKTIEIVFHSDFTVTRTSKPLVLKTNLSYEVSYTLVAQLPTKGLNHCNALLSRPPWEEKVRNVTVIMLVITLILVLVAVHIDYGNIMYQSSLYGARERGQVHPTFNLRNIAMSASSDVVETANCNGEGPGKSKNTLKKRNIAKPQKQANGDFNSFILPFSASCESTSKNKTSEKFILDKMDSNELKRTVSCKKSKAIDKSSPRAEDKENEAKDPMYDKSTKKDGKLRGSPKSANVTDKQMSECNKKPEPHTSENQSPPTGTTNEYFMQLLSWPSDFAQHKPVERKLFPYALYDSVPVAKESTGGRKLGKTPGRERRKQSGPISSQSSSSSSSTSTSSSSCSLPSQTKSTMAENSKRIERRLKPKAANAIKFTSQMESAYNKSNPSEHAVGTQSDQPEYYPDVLSPWDYGTQVDFSNILNQQPGQRPVKAATPPLELPEFFQTDSIPTFEPLQTEPYQRGMRNRKTSDVSSKYITNNPATSVNDLGPIGSKKSPSTTPSWEMVNNSAMNMQVPQPLIAKPMPHTVATSQHDIPYAHQQQQQQYASQNPNLLYYYSELAARQMNLRQYPNAPTEHELNITAKLLQIQAQEEFRSYMEQMIMQQRHQQYLQYMQTMRSEWPAPSPAPQSAWAPMERMDNCLNSYAAAGRGEPSSSAWSSRGNQALTPMPANIPMTAYDPSPGARVGGEGLFANTGGAVINSSTQAAHSGDGATAAAQENMPMFKLFGDLSCIWNDNWKQTVTNTQQQQQSEDKDVSEANGEQRQED